jgi:hypothetical protein
MNPRSAAEIAFGVAGVWLIVSRIPDFGVSLAFSLAGPDGLLRWLGVVHVGLVAVCGLGLVLLRRRLASWLVPMAQPDLTGPIAGFQAAAFSVIGLLLVARGLSDFLARLAVSVSGAWRPSFEEFVRPLAQIAVGLGLFLGARGFVTIWQSLRVAGRPRGETDDGVA